MKQVMVVFGTRPEAIKMAPVIKKAREYLDSLHLRVCVTGQHKEMLAPLLTLFDIIPDSDLEVMSPRQTITEMTARILTRLDQEVREQKPDFVLVQGDTTTAFVASLVGFYHQIPVGHIEAGLRTGERYYPFPEEINRKMVSVLSTLHFASTEKAVMNLKAEGIPEETIYLTGNPIVDALVFIQQKEIPLTCCEFSKLDFERRILLVTAHRRENFGAPLVNICRGLREIVRRHPDVEVVYPVHLNPNVQHIVYKHLSGQERIHLLPPINYDVFVHLMKKSYLILTDSGGVQEEAACLGKPLLVLRNQTERLEGVEVGIAQVIGTKTENIIKETSGLLQKNQKYKAMAKPTMTYGDGKASEKILRIIKSFLCC